MTEAFNAVAMALSNNIENLSVIECGRLLQRIENYAKLKESQRKERQQISDARPKPPITMTHHSNT